MDGYQFEYQCAEILKRNGFSRVQVTQSSGDQGVDIIAHKHRKKPCRKPTQVQIFTTATGRW